VVLLTAVARGNAQAGGVGAASRPVRSAGARVFACGKEKADGSNFRMF